MHRIILFLFCGSFAFQMSAQDDDFDAVVTNACSCLDEVSLSLERNERYDEIKNCIQTASISEQLNQSLMGALESVTDTLSKNSDLDSLELATKNTTLINSDKDYKEIQQELISNCPRMKLLLDNEENTSDLSDSEKAKEFYDKGQEFFSNENFEEAVVAFKEATKKDKNFAFAWDMLGYSYRKLDHFEDAIKAYNKSLAIEPSGRMPLQNKALAYLLMGDRDKAIEAYNAFSENYPDDPEGYYGSARVYAEKEDLENALDHMMHALVLYNKQGSPYARDAEANLVQYYGFLEANDNLALFEKVAEKYNIKFN